MRKRLFVDMDENFVKGNYTVAAIPPGLLLKSQEMNLSTLKDLDRQNGY